eukprot:3053538-Prorocentrum_lima.AAC.1
MAIRALLESAPNARCTCKHVNCGFFGAMAEASKVAAVTYMDNLADCKSALNRGKWGESRLSPTWTTCRTASQR